jgi:hypothetical protein
MYSFSNNKIAEFIARADVSWLANMPDSQWVKLGCDLFGLHASTHHLYYMQEHRLNFVDLHSHPGRRMTKVNHT